MPEILTRERGTGSGVFLTEQIQGFGPDRARKELVMATKISFSSLA